jgi:predicted DNA-binding transcriptional regulator YafY
MNISAQMRYQVIDKRLRNPNNRNHWEDLADACAMAAAEYFSNYVAPSKRTIAYDIQRMRSGALGYNAPIGFDKKNGYYYANPRFSIYNIPISNHVLDECREAVHILRNLTRNEKLFSLHQAIMTLEEKLNLQVDHLQKPIIYFEKSLNEQGQRWLNEVYEKIRHKKVMTVNYRPFDKPALTHILSPYFIKEYNNRWYVVGYEHNMQKVINIALDRFEGVQASLQAFIPADQVDHDAMYKYVYGVTIPDQVMPEKIVFKARPLLSRYLTTKPIHDSQSSLHSDDSGSYFSLFVVVNYEIRHKLLSYGEDIEVMEPQSLRHAMMENVKMTMALYETGPLQK